MDRQKQEHCHNCRNTGKRSWDDEKTLQDLIHRLNRIEGQIRGIKKMIVEGVYCDNVLNQIASASPPSTALQNLLEKHMKSCIKEQLQAGDDEVIDEITRTVFKLIK